MYVNYCDLCLFSLILFIIKIFNSYYFKFNFILNTYIQNIRLQWINYYFSLSKYYIINENNIHIVIY